MALEDTIELPPVPQALLDRFAGRPKSEQERLARAAHVTGLKGRLRAISTSPEWDLGQVVMQEVFSHHAIQNPDKKVVANAEKIIEYKQLVVERYAEEPETRDMLLTCTPAVETIKKWMRKPGWDDAVWNNIKTTGLFTKERRASMINSVYNKGIKGDTNAAKLWLQLSGDLTDGTTVGKNEALVDKFRDINKIIHSRSVDE
jgi:hypothetical protein